MGNNKSLNDYTCIEDDGEFLPETDSLQQILSGEEEKSSPGQKKNVRKAIERYLERKRLKSAIIDDFNLGMHP